MRFLVLALALVPVLAHADDKRIAAAKQLVVDQFDHLTDEKFTGWAKDGVGWFPGLTFDKDADTDMSSWAMSAPYLGKRTVAKSVAGWKGTWGWVAAQLDVVQRPYSDSSGGLAKSETHRYHYLGVVVADGATTKLKALLLTDSRPDAKLLAGKRKPTHGAVPPNSLAWLLVEPAKIKLAADAQVSILGSSQGEVALGGDAAKKLLASWSKLKLELRGAQKVLLDGDRGIVLSEVDLIVNGKSVRLRGMLVARKVGTGWEVVALAYGSNSQIGDPPKDTGEIWTP